MKHLRRPTVIAAATLSAAVTAGAIGLAANAGERTASDAIELSASERLDDMTLPGDVVDTPAIAAPQAAVVDTPVVAAGESDPQSPATADSPASIDSAPSPVSQASPVSAASPVSQASPVSADSPDSPASVASPASVDSD